MTIDSHSLNKCTLLGFFLSIAQHVNHRTSAATALTFDSPFSYTEIMQGYTKG